MILIENKYITDPKIHLKLKLPSDDKTKINKLAISIVSL